MVEKKVTRTIEDTYYQCDFCEGCAYNKCFVCRKDVCWEHLKEINLDRRVLSMNHLQLIVCKDCLQTSMVVEDLLEKAVKGIRYTEIRPV